MENLNLYFLWGVLLIGTTAYLIIRFQHKQLHVWSALIRVGLFLVLFYLLLPISEMVSLVKSPLMVLVDTSKSMGALVADHSDAPSSILPKNLTQALDDRYPDHEFFYYDLYPPHQELQHEPSSYERLSSPILQSLSNFLTEASLSQDSRVVLLSDGQDTDFEAFPTSFPLQQTEVAIDTVIWPTPKLDNEIAIVHVQNPRVVFDKTPVMIKATIQSHVSIPQQTGLVLTDGQAILNKKDVSLPSGEHTQDIEITWTPSQLGDSLLLLRLQPLDNEINLHNNLEYLPISVRSKKLKVLHIAGRPSWDVRHLRYFLKSIPGLDLISFYILRDPFQDSQTVPEHELALIQFPVQALFQTELFKFDTVIFHNFAIQSYLRNPIYQQSFQKYLKSGKKVIVVGGEQVIDGQKYKELFLEKEQPPIDFKFYDFPSNTLLSNSFLIQDFLTQQPTFPQVEVASPPNPMLERTFFGLGQVDWVFNPSLWKHQHPTDQETWGKSGAFSVFWQSLLYQMGYEQQNVFRDFRPNLPYTTADSIQGHLNLSKHQENWLDSLRLQVLDQLHNAVVWEIPVEAEAAQRAVQLPQLAPSLYELRLSCDCSGMSDISQTLTIVDEWIEQHDSFPKDDWLQQLSKSTGGQRIEL